MLKKRTKIIHEKQLADLKGSLDRLVKMKSRPNEANVLHTVHTDDKDIICEKECKVELKEMQTEFHVRLEETRESSDEIDVKSETEETKEEIEERLDHRNELCDPACWPDMMQPTVCEQIVSAGLCKIEKHKEYYPPDNAGRKFSNSFFSRRLLNGETIRRQWLM